MKYLLMLLCFGLVHGQECGLCKQAMVELKLSGGFAAVESLTEAQLSQGIYPGSDVVGRDEPKVVYYCRGCSHSYDPVHRYYVKASSDPKAFAVPLQDIISRTPIPARELQTRMVQFVQYRHEDGDRWEYVVTRSTEEIGVVDKRIADYLAGFKIVDGKIGEFAFTKETCWVDAYKDSYVRLEMSKGNVFKGKSP